MRAGSLQDTDSFEELIKYIFVGFLGGFENAMTTVANELRGFGERGMSLYYAAATINHTIGS